MILLDTSVIVDYLRSPTDRMRRLFLENGSAICGVTRAELLYGAKREDDLLRIMTALAAFRPLDIPESVWSNLGEHLFALRSHGITVPFQDALLATVAIYHQVELWTRDAHFKMMQPVLPALRLFVEPTTT